MPDSELKKAEEEVRRSKAALGTAINHLKVKIETNAEKASRLLNFARRPAELVDGYAKQIGTFAARDPRRIALVAITGGAAVGLALGLSSRAHRQLRSRGSPAMQEFLDRCRARWHFEKTAVELYGEILRKCPPDCLAQFIKIRDEEQSHAALLEETIRKNGADPNELTDSARITLMESSGLVNVAKNESYAGVLDALLTAELLDSAGWDLLIKLADKLGLVEARNWFDEALVAENRHLAFTRRLSTQTALARLTPY